VFNGSARTVDTLFDIRARDRRNTVDLQRAHAFVVASLRAAPTASLHVSSVKYGASVEMHR